MRKETEAELASGFLSFFLSSISRPLPRPSPFGLTYPPTTLMDVCRPTRDPPRRCPPTDRLCPRRENSRGVDLLLSGAGYLSGRCTRSSLEDRQLFPLIASSRDFLRSSCRSRARRVISFVPQRPRNQSLRGELHRV